MEEIIKLENRFDSNDKSLAYLINARKIKEWMEVNKTTKKITNNTTIFFIMLFHAPQRFFLFALVKLLLFTSCIDYRLFFFQ